MQLGRAIAEDTGVRDEPHIQELVEKLSREMARIEKANNQAPRAYSAPTGSENGVTYTTKGAEQTAEIIAPENARQTADVIAPQDAAQRTQTITPDAGNITTHTTDDLGDEQPNIYASIHPTIMAPTGEWTITVRKTGEREELSTPRQAADGTPDGNKPIATAS